MIHQLILRSLLRAAGTLIVNLPESVALAETATGSSGVTKIADEVETAVVSIVSWVVPVGKTALPTEADKTSGVETLILEAVMAPSATMLPWSSMVTLS